MHGTARRGTIGSTPRRGAPDSCGTGDWRNRDDASELAATTSRSPPSRTSPGRLWLAPATSGRPMAA